MKFLIDNVLSPSIAKGLCEAGHDAVHIRDKGMQSASDEEVFELAAKENRVLVSADTDFGTLIALRQEKEPSIVIFRRSDKRPQTHLHLLLTNIEHIKNFLEKGSIVVFDETQIRVRNLPIGKEEE